MNTKDRKRLAGARKRMQSWLDGENLFNPSTLAALARDIHGAETALYPFRDEIGHACTSWIGAEGSRLRVWDRRGSTKHNQPMTNGEYDFANMVKTIHERIRNNGYVGLEVTDINTYTVALERALFYSEMCMKHIGPVTVRWFRLRLDDHLTTSKRVLAARELTWKREQKESI
jgi:hypothetical protein